MSKLSQLKVMLSQSVANIFGRGIRGALDRCLSKLYSAIFKFQSIYIRFSLSSAELIGVKTDPNSMYFSGTGYGTPAEEKPEGFETTMEALSRGFRRE